MASSFGLKYEIGSAMEGVERLIRQVAPSDVPVLLTGESGTGKASLARRIHQLGPRENGPFVCVHCGGLPEERLESELFGHVRGAFLGAPEDRIGRFEAAHTGTLFLDAIDAIPSRLQVQLLRLLEDRELERMGDPRTVRVDTRTIASTSRDLYDEVEQGRFRADLYYRLHAMTVVLPPLRYRAKDIPALVEHFLQLANEENHREVSRIEPSVMEVLRAYDWPGNLRELRACIERAVVLATDDELTRDLLPENMLPEKRGKGDQHPIDLDTLCRELVERGLSDAGPEATQLHGKIVRRVERELISQVLDATDRVQTRAAERLGLNRNTLHKKLKDYELDS